MTRLDKLTALAERVAGLNAAAGEIGAGMLAQLVSEAQDALTSPDDDQPLHEIQARWASRKWPSIGYFVHGQAYQDIHALLDMVMNLRGSESPRTEYDKGATHCAAGIRAGVETLTRYDAVLEWGDAFCEETVNGQYLRRDDVLTAIGAGEQ